MEKECLDLLLRGRQRVVICPALSIERMRLPVTWPVASAEARLLVLSPFDAHHRQPTAVLAEQRNRFAAALADEIFVAHASDGSRIDRLCAEIMAQGKRMYTLDLVENTRLIQRGAIGYSVGNLVEILTHR